MFARPGHRSEHRSGYRAGADEADRDGVEMVSAEEF